MNMRLATAIVLCGLTAGPFSFHALAQELQPSGSPHLSASAEGAPQELDASDGVYDRFVLIRWDAAAQATGYKIFRTTHPRGANLQEISKGWQKSNWFCDYTALPGVDYYYAVAANAPNSQSAISAFDKGYVRARGETALDPTLLTDNGAVANPHRRFLLIAGVSTDRSVYAPGQQMEVQTALQNIFSQETPRTELRYYLSEDPQLHWSDALLLSKAYSRFPADNEFSLPNVLTLPTALAPGQYYLIVVAAPEGEVIHSKLGTAIINIQ